MAEGKKRRSYLRKIKKITRSIGVNSVVILVSIVFCSLFLVIAWFIEK